MQKQITRRKLRITFDSTTTAKELANLLLRLPDSATFDESVESLENDTAAFIFHHEHEEAFEEYKASRTNEL